MTTRRNSGPARRAANGGNGGSGALDRGTVSDLSREVRELRISFDRLTSAFPPVEVTDKAVFARPPPEKGAVEENADTVLALSEEVAQVRQVIEALANREFTIRI
jgi:hypothetical protein